jgi:dTDP-4-dehydrorhamnose reductase
LGAYGRSKLAGDQAILAVDGNHLIFRLCWVYGARGNNFLLTMTRLARERETLRVVADQFGSPTWSRMIAETTALALKQVIDEQDFLSQRGIYHLCASGQTSWHGFAKAIVDSMPVEHRKCREIQSIAAADYPTPAKRPAYSVMSCEKLERAFNLRLPSWDASLRDVIEELNH